MSDSRSRRILRELEEFRKDKPQGIELQVVGSDVTHLKGQFKGPADTPYEKGLFTIDIAIPDDYPFKPPKMKFDTRVYHPNISSQTGAICLDILKDQWSPVLSLRSALISLQSLLSTPEPNDPQDAQVASHYIKDRKSFDETAQYWAENYACGDNPKIDPIELYGLDRESVSDFENMGFTQEKVIEAMRSLNIRNAQGREQEKVLEILLKESSS